MAEDYIAVIGAMSMDVAGKTDDALVMGDSNPGKISLTAGGVGRNIAHNLVTLKKQVQLISMVGDDAHGAALLEGARATGIGVEHCYKVVGGVTPTYLTLHDHEGEMVVAVNDMKLIESLLPAHLEPYLSFLARARALVVDCGLSEDTLGWLLHQKGLGPIFIDTVSAYKCMRIAKFLPFIHTLKPNWLEAEKLSNIPIKSAKDLVRVAHWFHEQGLKYLVISGGERGVYYSESGGASGFIPALKARIVNVSGAGDALMAGLVCGWLEGWQLYKAACFAQSCALITLEAQATNSPNLSFDHAMQIYWENYEDV